MHQRHVKFKECDLVLINLRRERFPLGKFGKLQPKANGPFRVLQCIGKNAYKVKLPDTYEVSSIFNIVDLSSYYGQNTNSDLRTSLFQPEEIDIGHIIQLGSKLRHDSSNIVLQVLYLLSGFPRMVNFYCFMSLIRILRVMFLFLVRRLLMDLSTSVFGVSQLLAMLTERHHLLVTSSRRTSEEEEFSLLLAMTETRVAIENRISTETLAVHFLFYIFNVLYLNHAGILIYETYGLLPFSSLSLSLSNVSNRKKKKKKTCSGHTHLAEKLKVPLHVFFTMPWTPTSEFPHPLSRVKQQVGYRLSYYIVDALIWLGIRDMINELRKKKLKLRPVTYLRGSYCSPPDVPYGYLWSPHLAPKPKDWGPKIDVVGFCFLDLASSYEPPESLVKWLEDGEKPIYIGFGSLPVQEPERMTQKIVQALEKTGQGGIINKGWGGLGNLAEPKDFVYLLDNCPHDWLFLRCVAVVHHGGAGTIAAGLRAACPTTIVPFFGDQLFWGERVHARGVGPAPIPVDKFSLDSLVDAIYFMLDPEVKKRAVKLAKDMEGEDGVAGAVNAFYKHFPGKKPKDEPVPAPAPSGLFSIRRWFGHART
ncbi:sterol 3-beta-glucosyltransferase UGT80A2-like [Durio zibethinus]|uniref:Sterol 3-beta-glucosyltransferase UGT80A2-like n=1 Tax=Durio zibethinus TaxID=66656 RepID=A0A6P5WVT9_DURZI|nr:sterol 3-beta-glucosyltransferase UGT80A2-like [Durio zibethinus]